MRSIRIIFGFLVAVGTSFTLMAGEVGNLIQFQPNTKAKSSEVNQNFDTIKNAVNDNNSRISNLESFKGNVAGSSCGSGNAVTGFSADGTPQCEDMNKGKKILSVTYPGSCFAVVEYPKASAPGILYVPIIGEVGPVILEDMDNTDNPNRIYCPITLPEGSKILKIIVTVYDNTASEYINISLIHVPAPSNDSGVNHFTVNSSDNASPQDLVIDFSSDPEPVERGVPYAIEAYFSSDQQSGSLKIYKATVIYEYDPTYLGTAP